MMTFPWISSSVMRHVIVADRRRLDVPALQVIGRYAPLLDDRLHCLCLYNRLP